MRKKKYYVDTDELNDSFDFVNFVKMNYKLLL